MTLTYLDNNATTRPAPQVVDALVPFLREGFGNPSSAHILGQRAAYAVQEARHQVAACLGAEPAEIVFTSGGTESDNLAIRGLLQANPQKRHMVTSAVEHEAIFRLAQQLDEEGCSTSFVGVDAEGLPDLEALAGAIRADTAVVTVMLANNETGVLLPIAEITKVCRRAGVPLHSDAVQAVGKIPLDVDRLGVDLLSLSAHKFHGPKGVGALYVRAGTRLRTQIIGGLQEGDLRGGTENVPGIVGLGVASELARQEGESAALRMAQLRDHLESELLERFAEAVVIGRGAPRLPNTSLMSFPGVTAEGLLIGLSEHGVCASGGSACHSGALKPSRVLVAMGVNLRRAAGTVRFSLSRYSTAADVAHLLDVLPGVVRRLQSQSTAAP